MRNLLGPSIMLEMVVPRCFVEERGCVAGKQGVVSALEEEGVAVYNEAHYASPTFSNPSIQCIADLGNAKRNAVQLHGQRVGAVYNEADNTPFPLSNTQSYNTQQGHERPQQRDILSLSLSKTLSASQRLFSLLFVH